MDKINFKNLPDKTTSITAEKLNKIQENVEKAINEKSSLPVGGDEGQILAKASNQDNDVEWIDNIGQGGGDTLPIGAILPFSGDIIPNGWLLCDGSSFSVTSYPELFDVIGTTYGYDDDRNPKLPDLRGRVAVGKKDATSADDTEFSSLGKTGGGTAKDKIKVAGTYYGLVDTKIVSGTGYGGQGLVSVTKNTSESAQSLDNNGIDFMPPHLVTNFIIKAKNTAVVKGDVIQEDGTASETNVYSATAVNNKIENSAKTNIVTGQEIATNEYIDGKRVYLKRATFTTPNAVDIWKTMITIPANSEIVNSYQVYETESSKYPFPFSYNNESMQIYYNSNDGTINVKINFAYALNKNGYIIVKYTKNT